MREINPMSFSHIRQTSIKCVCKIVFIKIIGWVEPLFLEFAPKGFRNIQMWRIRRQKEQIQTSFLPVRYSFLYDFSLVYSGIIQYYKGCTSDFKRKLLQKLQNKLRVYIFLRNLIPISALPADNPQAVKLIGFACQKADILIGKLPAVRNITFTANVRFIPVIKVYAACEAHLFTFLQFFCLKTIMFSQRFCFRAAPYTFISSASVFKKDLKVVSHTSLPLSASHCALAVRIRCRLALIVARIESLSSSCERIALRPRPDLVCKPNIPSLLYRFTQLLTLIAHVPVIVPTSSDLHPSDFNNILWQRIRKQWLSPYLKLSSSSSRWAAVSIGVYLSHSRSKDIK